MTRHLRNDDLQELLGGSLPEVKASNIRRHLEQCDVCRKETETLAGLVASLRSLPQEIRPARDLRAEMWRRIDEDENGHATTPPTVRDGEITPRSDGAPARHRMAPSRWSLAAAALVLVAVAAAISIATGGPGAGEDPSGAAAVPALRVAEERYESASRELEALLDEQRAMLAPETREVLDRSLAAIDAAVAEARAALAEDPGNTMLAHMLMTAYDKKLDILRAAAQAPVGI